MKVLITGCYGFIGYSVAVRLLKMGHEVIGIDKVTEAVSPKASRIQNLNKFGDAFKVYDINLVNYEQMDTLFKLIDFDVVFHSAGQYSVAYTTESMLAYANGNVRTFLHVIDGARQRGVKRVLYASSTFVQDGVMSPSMYGATLEFRERAAYVYSSMGMETVGLRFGSTYGPYIRPDVGIYIIAKKLFGNQPINVQEGGFKYRSGFLYVADAVECVVRLLMNPLPQSHNVFTLVANDNTRHLGEVLHLLQQYSGIKPRLVGEFPEVSDPGYVPTERLLPLQKVIDYMPHTTMEEGVEKFTKWFKGQYEAGLIR